MSWQSYIDDQILAAGCMYGTINGHDGSLWASSPGFTVTAEEITTIASVFDKNDFTPISAKGFAIAGQNYTFVRGEVDEESGTPSFIQGRCKEDGKSAQGVIIFGTTQAIIIGVHDPEFSNGHSFRTVNSSLGRVADYMLDSGF